MLFGTSFALDLFRLFDYHLSMDNKRSPKESQSFISDRIAEYGWTQAEFIGHCAINGIGKDTAINFWNGKTNFRIVTLEKLGGILGVSSISELVEFI